MLRVALFIIVAALAGPAAAAEKVVLAPPPDWVKPVEVTPPPLGDTGPPVRILLQDRQLHFGAEGDAEFVEQVAQIRTSAGLMGSGSIALPWNPDTDTLTVHRLRILRGGETIDVLARQSFAVLRRESNLERATLDGVLTASLQPEGLQVGDVVDLAYTVTHADPVMRGYAERGAYFPPALKADRLHVRATWDAGRNLDWRVGEGLDKPKVAKSGGRVELTIDMKDPPTPKAPAGAPPRFFPRRELVVSQFHSWPEVSALLAPLFDKAAALTADSPLKAEAAKIRAAASDPKVQAGLALRLVEDNVRYLALLMNQGGYVPAPADLTWQRRFGDCKAKTVLLIALLHELGLQAEPAVVASTGGDGMDARLPGLTNFDHVIVRATIAGQTYWLDGTRSGDRKLDSLPPPPFRWALPLRTPGAGLVAVEPQPRTEPDTVVTLRIDASRGLDAPAPTHGELKLGAAGGLVASVAGNLPPAEREKSLKFFWTPFAFVEVKSDQLVTDPETGETRLVMEGVSHLPWPKVSGVRTFRINGAELGSRASYKRDADAPHADAPYLLADYPTYASFELALTLPDGGKGFSYEGADVDTKIAGRAYGRRGRIEGGVLTLQTSQRALVREIPAAEAAGADKALADLAKVKVSVHAPASYHATEGDIAAWREAKIETAEQHIDRGNLFLSAARNDLAMADFDKAVELAPDSPFAYANRGLGHVYGGRLEQAKADIAKAQALDSRNFVALHGVGLIAMQEGRFTDAAAAFARASDLKKDNLFALQHMAGAYLALDEPDKALAATDDMLRINPGLVEVRIMRYRAFAMRGETDRAKAEMDGALKAAPNDPALQVEQAGLLAEAGQRAEADAAFTKVIAAAPSAEAYLARARHGAADATAARLADLDAAAKLEPKNPAILPLRALVLSEAGRHAEAVQAITAALKDQPDSAGLLMQRGEAYARAGQAELALKDFAQVRAKAAKDPVMLNALCWAAATANVALDAALADCAAALTLNPGYANAVDSRGFVLMRMGRLPEALAAYDEAVKARPDWAESLYGRGMTRLRLGMAAEGEADLAQAIKRQPGLTAAWARYGVSRPTTPAAAKNAPPAAAAPSGL